MFDWISHLPMMADVKEHYVTYIIITVWLICITMTSCQAEIWCDKLPGIEKRVVINGYHCFVNLWTHKYILFAESGVNKN